MESLLEYIPLSSNERFPVFRNLWELFSAKGNKTVFLSIGESTSPLVELHCSETLGCKIHLVSDNSKVQDQWNELKEVLQTRKTTESTSDFAKQALKKWVLPHNILVSPTPLSFSTLQSSVASICSLLDVEERIDILKIDTTVCRLAETLYAILHFGYRPAMVLLHWAPDSTLETTLLAGHLQNVGYGLVAKSENKYLYYFTDKNLYELCSWETTDVVNPLVATLLEAAQLKNPEKQ
jgi:hypothetical protein